MPSHSEIEAARDHLIADMRPDIELLAYAIGATIGDVEDAARHVLRRQDVAVVLAELESLPLPSAG